MPSKIELFIVFALYTALYFLLYRARLFAFFEEREVKIYIFYSSVLLISFVVYIIFLNYRFPIVMDMTKDFTAYLISLF